jgi:hypothetical protein
MNRSKAINSDLIIRFKELIDSNCKAGEINSLKIYHIPDVQLRNMILLFKKNKIIRDFLETYGVSFKEKGKDRVCITLQYKGSYVCNKSKVMVDQLLKYYELLLQTSKSKLQYNNSKDSSICNNSMITTPIEINNENNQLVIENFSEQVEIPLVCSKRKRKVKEYHECSDKNKKIKLSDVREVILQNIITIGATSPVNQIETKLFIKKQFKI